jgi:hypothetical protein
MFSLEMAVEIVGSSTSKVDLDSLSCLYTVVSAESLVVCCV